RRAQQAQRRARQSAAGEHHRRRAVTGTFRSLLFAGLLGGPAVLVCAPPSDALAQGKQGHDDISLAVGETRTLPATGVKEYSERAASARASSSKAASPPIPS